ncbi:PAS domain S-box protein [candidate division KSB1 bacterium]|nr:PAS domain S-box protein [candidate division KSB1 bacterium]
MPDNSGIAADNNKKKVLILNSYHQGYKWSDDIVSSIQNKMNSYHISFEFYIEYMDTKRVHVDGYLEQLYKIYKIKYRQQKFDIIICSDNNAYDFLIKYHNELFPKTPIVFCGITLTEETANKHDELFTGVIEKLDVLPTIELIKKFHPHTRFIYIVTDNTTSGVAQRKEVELQVKNIRDLEFIYLDGRYLTTEEMLEQIKNLPDNAVLIPITWLRDRTGESLEYKEYYPLICKTSPVPVYGFGDIFLGMGIIGGKLSSGAQQGKLAAKIAGQILNGKKPSALPIITDNQNRHMFDYYQMRRYNISLSDIPANSIIINKSFSFFSRHKGVIWLSITIILMLALIIAVLSVNIISRQKTERALRESQERYKTLVETAPESVILMDLENIILFASQHTSELHGFKTSEEMVNNNFLKYIQTDDRKDARQKLYEIKNTGTVRNLEYRFIRKNGSLFDGELNASTVYNADNHPIAIIAIVRDITERKHTEEQIKASLQEKVVLLKEIHHRVKNNMQIICSLLSLQEKHIPDKKSLKVFQETKSRVLAMALIHEKLYQSQNLAKINFYDYTKSLTNDMHRSYLGKPNMILFTIEGQDLYLDINKAIPCGLIINELVTNSIKYGFPDSDQGEVIIRLSSKNGENCICVQDSGIGLPEDLNFKTSGTFGFQMVNALVAQLDGKINIESGQGTKISIFFP